MRIVRLSMLLSLLSACDCSSSPRDRSPADDGSTDSSTSDASTSDASTSDASVAATLAGLRWELPCASTYNEWNCNVTDPQPVVATLGGDLGVTYQVTLRFRGIVEGKTYVGGTTVDRFNDGGTPATDSYNIYALVVSEPPQTYYLNAGESGIGRPFEIDYSSTIAIAAGATVTLTATAIDGVQHMNLDASDIPMVVDGVAPAPDAYDGQFVQMDVVSVASP